MIHIKVFGNSRYLPLLFILVYTGCSSHKIIQNKSFQRDIREVHDIYTEVFSPAQKFYLMMPGDYTIKNNINRKELKSIKKLFNRELPLNMNFKKSFVFKGETIVSPYYENMLFIDSVSSIAENQKPQNFLSNKNQKPFLYYLQVDQGKRLLYVSYLSDYKKVIGKIEAEDNLRIIRSHQEKMYLNLENQRILDSLKFNSNYVVRKVPPFMATFRLFQEDTLNLNYIAPIHWVKYYHSMYRDDPADSWQFWQTALTYMANIKNYPSYQNNIKSIDAATCKDMEEKNITYSLSPFYGDIYQIAQENDILIFNENHWIPKHRCLISSILEGCYQAGYRNLAVEALGNNGNSIMQQGCILLQDGFYTCEPEMSNMLHKAIDLGYKLIQYEAEEAEDRQEREIQQAENIWKGIKNSPDKTLILCGFDHISLDSSQQWMGYLLKKMANKKIFTINQTRFNCLSSQMPETSVYMVKNISDSSYLNRSQNDSYVVNNLGECHSDEDHYKKLNTSDIIEQKFNNNHFLLLYREKDYKKYGAACIPVSIYFLSGQNFDLMVPKHEPILILVKNWQNDTVYSVTINEN